VWRAGQDPKLVAESKKPGRKQVPAMHSSAFYPVIEGSISNGVLSMSSAVLNLVGKK